MPKSKRFMPSIRVFSPRWEQVTDLNWFREKTKRKWISLDGLIGTQSWVRLQGVKDADLSHPIFVVVIGGKSYIRDGHHRVTRALELGRRAIPAEVLDLGD